MVVTDFFFFFFSFLVIYSCRPKLARMTETRRNWPKFFPRWNKGVLHSGLHIGTRFSGRSGRNGTERNGIYNSGLMQRKMKKKKIESSKLISLKFQSETQT
jgi:hypothetical protein